MKKKTLAMLLSTALVITTASFGTIAYLTDRAAITNRFTIGNVSIDVDEAVVTPDGEPVDSDNDGSPDRTTEVNGEEGNTYHLMPGQTYTKDPTLTVKANSEESYVRMLVTITHIDRLKAIANVSAGQFFLPENYVKDADGQSTWNSAVWPCVGITEGTATINAGTEDEATVPAATYEFRYHTTVAGMKDGEPADVTLEPLFTAFTVPGELTGEQLAQLQPVEIRVVGQAIQKEGFDTPDLAWAEFPETTVTITSTTPDQQEDNAAGV